MPFWSVQHLTSSYRVTNSGWPTAEIYPIELLPAKIDRYLGIPDLSLHSIELHVNVCDSTMIYQGHPPTLEQPHPRQKPV